MKPNLFRFADFISFCSPFIVSSALTIYAAFNGVTGSALALLFVLSAMFLAVYVALLITRYNFLKKITFSTRHGLNVITNGFDVPQNEIEQITEDTITKWAMVLRNHGQNITICRSAVKNLYVYFREFPIEHNTLGKLAGYAIGDNVVVGHKTDLSRTAFAHELGHFIYREWTGTFENTNCHAFMKQNGLP